MKNMTTLMNTLTAESVVQPGAPSDWPDSCPGLKELDTLLRCAICFEYMKTTMLLSGCSHNYCSLCIRRYICYKEQCPTCLKHVVESDLRNNRALDHIIEIFRSSRPLLLRAVGSLPAVESSLIDDNQNCDQEIENKKEKKSVTRLFSTEQPLPTTKHKFGFNFTSKSTSRRTEEKKDNAVGQETVDGRRKTLKSLIILSDSEEDSDATVDVSPPRDISLKDVTEADLLEMSDATIDDCNNIEFLSPSRMVLPSSPKVAPLRDAIMPTSNALFRSPLATVNSRYSSVLCPPVVSVSVDQAQKPADHVSCPVCSVYVPARNINLHLDRCLTLEKNPSSVANSIQTPKRKCLPKLVYNLLSDKELRKKVAEVGLPVHGDRKTMIARHREYTLIYNSECDSLNPKSGADIVRDILNAETNKALSTSSSTASLPSLLRMEKNASSDDVETARQQYAQQHKSQFQQLIEAARKNRELKAKSASTDVKQSVSTNSLSTVNSELTSTISSIDSDFEDDFDNTQQVAADVKRIPEHKPLAKLKPLSTTPSPSHGSKVLLLSSPVSHPKSPLPASFFRPASPKSKKLLFQTKSPESNTFKTSSPSRPFSQTKSPQFNGQVSDDNKPLVVRATSRLSLGSLCSNSSSDIVSSTALVNLPKLAGLSGSVSDSDSSQDFCDVPTRLSSRSSDLLSNSGGGDWVPGECQSVAPVIGDGQHSNGEESSSSLPPTQNNSLRISSTVDGDVGQRSSPGLLCFFDGNDSAEFIANSSLNDATLTNEPSTKQDIAVAELDEHRNKRGRKPKQQVTVTTKETAAECHDNTDAQEPAEKRRRLRSESKRDSGNTVACDGNTAAGEHHENDDSAPRLRTRRRR